LAIPQRKKEEYMKILAGIGIVIIIVVFALSSWFIGRKINYSLSYENMVRQTIIETVKEDCLK
jgi:flagellar basal body-associated protein FliL